jgi:hypothetical protein
MSHTEGTPSRRRLLAGATAALATGAAIATAAHAAPVASPDGAGDDAALIRLCAEFHRLNAVQAAWSHDDDDGFGANLNQRCSISDNVMALSATTDRGRREKAAVALVLFEDMYGTGDGYTTRTTLAALRDIAGRADA